MNIIEKVELPGKKGKVRTVFRIPLEPYDDSPLGTALWSCIHLKSMHTFDYEAGYIEFMSESDAEKYAQKA